MTAHSGRGIWMRVIALIAIAFGLLTIREGGAVLFFDGAARAAAGSYVPFVLWFNFLAGFVYVLAGVGLLRAERWAAAVALFLAVATVLVFVAFGVYALAGGAFEMGTVGALSVRSLFWIVLALLARHQMQASTAKSNLQ